MILNNIPAPIASGVGNGYPGERLVARLFIQPRSTVVGSLTDLYPISTETCSNTVSYIGAANLGNGSWGDVIESYGLAFMMIPSSEEADYFGSVNYLDTDTVGVVGTISSGFNLLELKDEAVAWHVRMRLILKKPTTSANTMALMLLGRAVDLPDEFNYELYAFEEKQVLSCLHSLSLDAYFRPSEGYRLLQPVVQSTATISNWMIQPMVSVMELYKVAR